MADADFTQPFTASFDADMAELTKLMDQLTSNVCHQGRLAGSLRGIAAVVDLTDLDSTSICAQATMEAIGAAAQQQASAALKIINDVQELLERLAAMEHSHG